MNWKVLAEFFFHVIYLPTLNSKLNMVAGKMEIEIKFILQEKNI